MKSYMLIILILLTSLEALAQQRKSEYVSFGSDGTKITGILVRSSLDKKLPAVVFQQGSGPFSFEGYENEAWGPHGYYIEEVLLKRGYAVLYCNKRGLGGSEGSWKKNSFEGRAKDALAAVNYLRSRNDINTDNIGIAGHSQGGWIAMMAAAEDANISFVLSLAGPTVGVTEQSIQLYKYNLECKGLSDEKIESKSTKKLKRMKSSAGLGKSLKFIRSAYHWSLIHDYNHDESLKALTRPTLLLFAEYDNNVDAEQNVDHLNHLFNGRVPDNYTIEIMASGQHGFYQVKDRCVDWDQAITQPLDENFKDKIDKWLSINGF